MSLVGSMKDEIAGEVPVAFVVKFNDSAITEDEIKQFISTQVVQIINWFFAPRLIFIFGRQDMKLQAHLQVQNLSNSCQILYLTLVC